MNGRIAVLASTRGTVLQALIDAQRAGKLGGTIEVLVSDCGNCGAVEKAKAAGIETVLLDAKGADASELDEEIIRELDARQIDLVLLAGYMRILGRKFVEKYGLRTINTHPSLLPAFAGGRDMNVHKAVLESGAKRSGCTLHFISEKADAGPIIMRKEVDVLENDTPETLKERVQDAEKEAVVEAANKFLEGKIKVESGRVSIQ